MPDFISISYSRIDTFKQCPKKFYAQSIQKPSPIPYVQTEAQRQGDLVHKMFQDRIEKGTPFPFGYEKYEPIAATIERVQGQTFCELSLNWTKELEPCGEKEWDRCWLRVKLDITKILDSIAWTGDYKTGKRHFDELQLKIYAAALFHAFPDLESVYTNFLWLQEKDVDQPTKYVRADAPKIWAEIFDYSRQMEEAKKLNHWPARRNPFCGYCGLNKAGLCQEAKDWGIKPR